MKHILYILLFAILTFGCGNNQKQKVHKDVQKTSVSTAAEIRQKEIQDSIQQVRLDSLALIAWGDVKFGMNMKKASATDVFKGGNKYNNSISINFEYEREIKKLFGFTKLAIFWGEFKDNELIEIRIESGYQPASQLDYLIRDCDIFIDNFKKKYGSPLFVKDKVNISEFDYGSEFEYAKFQIGNKKITILLKQNWSEITFKYEIHIKNDEFPTKKHVQTEEETKKVRKQIENAEKIRNNSF